FNVLASAVTVAAAQKRAAPTKEAEGCCLSTSLQCWHLLKIWFPDGNFRPAALLEGSRSLGAYLEEITGSRLLTPVASWLP
ncbi:hypothetical protein LEMLEM_LOCUS6194, partial [Lemmus lemmus]